MLDVLKTKQNDVEDLSGYLRAEEFNTVFEELKKVILTYEDLEDIHKNESNDQLVKVVDILIKTNTYLDVGDQDVLTLIRPSVRNSPDTFIDGMTFDFIPKHTNSDKATIQLGTLARKPIMFNGEDLLDNELKEGLVHTAKYNKEHDRFDLLFINAGKSDNIYRPKIVIPEMYTPNFTGIIRSDEFRAVDKYYKGIHTGSNWTMATDKEFKYIIAEKKNSRNGLQHFSAKLTAGVRDYYVKVQYLSAGLKSTWSKPIKFTTPAIFVQLPIIEVLGGTNNVVEMAMFKTQPFAITGESGQHLNTSWIVKDALGNTVYELQKSTTHLTSISLPEQILNARTHYTVEVQYNGKLSNNYDISSEWGLTTFYTDDSYFREPALYGPEVANELTTVDLEIMNYRPYYDYTIMFDQDNATRHGNIIRWKMGKVSFDTIKNMGITARYKDDTSKLATHTIMVKDVPIIQPIISGPDEAIENTDIVLVIDNYNPKYSYKLKYDVDNCKILVNKIYWKLPDVKVDSIGRVVVTAEEHGDITAPTEFSVLIKRKPLVNPIIGGPSSVNEETTRLFTIDNYDPDNTYDISTTLGEVIDPKTNMFKIKFPDIEGNKKAKIYVVARKDTEVSNIITKDIYVMHVPITSDDIISITDFSSGSYNDGWLYQNVVHTNDSLRELVNLYKNNIDDNDLASSIINANTSQVTDMSELFKDFREFNLAIGKWNTSKVTTMRSMFEGRYHWNHSTNVVTDNGSKFNQDIGDWDVGRVTNMSKMFYGARAFNKFIYNWNTYNVTDMSYMFSINSSEASTSKSPVFNQEVSAWDVRNVTNMEHMFNGCRNFNLPLSSWYTKSLTNTSHMFYNCRKFNYDINNWDVSKVTNMSSMFGDCYVFNKPLDKWNTSNVTDMSEMFYSAMVFNQNIGGWDVSNVTNMKSMFNYARAFNQDLNFWNVSNVTNMHSMFSRAIKFNTGLMNWKTNKVTDMSSMFNNAEKFNTPIDTWDVSNVTNMSSMFRGATKFNMVLSSWKTGKVKDMSEMFAGNFSSDNIFNQPLNNWDVSKVTNMYLMFSHTSNFNRPLDKWNTGNVTKMHYMFSYAKAFNNNIGTWNTSKVTDMRSMFKEAVMFNNLIWLWNTGNVTNMSEMFKGAIRYTKAVYTWNVSNVTNMSEMFREASQFNSSLGGWNTSKVTTMRNMFYSAYRFNQPMYFLDVSKVTDMAWMFGHNGNTGDFNGKFEKGSEMWDTGKVTDMEGMFQNCNKLETIPLNLNVSKVTDMKYMFTNCSKFNASLGNWNVSNVTDMRAMFGGCNSFTGWGLTTWNVSKVTDMYHAFIYTSLNNGVNACDLSNWNVSKVTIWTDIFKGNTLDTSFTDDKKPPKFR